MHTVSKKLLEINSWNEFVSFANTFSEKGKGDLFLPQPVDGLGQFEIALGYAARFVRR